jgi:hypothetical protein
MKKTFAQLKRDLQLGTKIQMIKREVNGKEEKVITEEREISIVQSNAIAFKTLKADGTVGNSWLYFPKASQVEYIGNTFIINDGYFKLTYEIIK